MINNNKFIAQNGNNQPSLFQPVFTEIRHNSMRHHFGQDTKCQQILSANIWGNNIVLCKPVCYLSNVFCCITILFCLSPRHNNSSQIPPKCIGTNKAVICMKYLYYITMCNQCFCQVIKSAKISSRNQQ